MKNTNLKRYMHPYVYCRIICNSWYMKKQPGCPWTEEWIKNTWYVCVCVCVWINKFMYSLETQRKRGRDIGRGRSRLPSGSPVWDSILGPQDHNLSQNQMLKHWATQACLYKRILHNHKNGWDLSISNNMDGFRA